MADPNHDVGEAAGIPESDERLLIEERVVGLLARREHSRAELLRKLSARGFQPAAVRSVVDALADRGLQSDERFAELFVRQRFANGIGVQRVRAELAQRGIESTIIDAALAGQEDDPVERATELLARRYRRALADADAVSVAPRERQRLLRFLAQRGFDFETARAALARLEAAGAP